MGKYDENIRSFILPPKSDTPFPGFKLEHPVPPSHSTFLTLMMMIMMMMQQSLSVVIFFAALLTTFSTTTLANPSQQFYYTNPHSSDNTLNDDLLSNDDQVVEASSNDGRDATAADSSSSSTSITPVSVVADNLSTERPLPGTTGNFLIPIPPSWRGTDDNIAPQFTCENSHPYCCTGKYIRRKGWVLGPCDPCSL